MERRTRILITVVIVLILLGYLVYSTVGGSFLYYRTVSEIKMDESLHGKPVRVIGKVVKGSFEEKEGGYRFKIFDGKEEILVLYKGILPSTFKEDAEVIAEGIYERDVGIRAKNLLARCPSKYITK